MANKNLRERIEEINKELSRETDPFKKGYLSGIRAELASRLASREMAMRSFIPNVHPEESDGKDAYGAAFDSLWANYLKTMARAQKKQQDIISLVTSKGPIQFLLDPDKRIDR